MKTVLRVFAVLLLLTSFSIAETYYVSNSGSNGSPGTSEGTAWQTLGYSEARLSPGDTLLIMGGYWDEQNPLTAYPGWYGTLVITHSGTAQNPIVYKACPGYPRPVIYGADDYLKHCCWAQWQHHIVFDSLIATKGLQAGFMLRGCDSMVVKNCVSFDHEGGPGDNNGGAVFIGQNADEPSWGNIIRACTLYTVRLPGGGSGTNAAGIMCYRCFGGLIEDNVIYDAFDGIRLKLDNDSNIIRNNIIYGCHSGAASSSDGQYNKIYNNIIYDIEENGFYTRNMSQYQMSENIEVYNNTFYNCGGPAIDVGEFTASDLGEVRDFHSWNNLIVNCGRGMLITDPCCGATGHTNMYLNYNIYYNGGSSIRFMMESVDYVGLPAWRTRTGQEANSTNQDPLFVNAAAHDFRIPVSSPAATTGRGNGYLTYIGALPPTGSDSDPPTFDNIAVTNITNSSATITWTTNEPANSQVRYGLTSGYGSSTTLNTTLVTSHSQTITGLSTTTQYHFQVISTDGFGNTGSSGDNTFTTSASAPSDNTPPTFSNIFVSNITTTTAIVHWTTNEPATSQVEFGLTTGYGLTSQADPSTVYSHTVTLTDLDPNTLYQFRAVSTDTASNTARSANSSLRTLQASENLALGVTPGVSGTYDGYDSLTITDGVINASGGTATTWCSHESSSAHYIDLDFGTTQDIKTVKIFWATNTYISQRMISQQLRIQQWNGSGFTDVITVVPEEGVNTDTANGVTNIGFNNITTSRIRILQPANMGPTSYSTIMWVTEVEVYFNDYAPPAKIGDLSSTTGQNPGELNLGWDAPGDNALNGTASWYEVKLSTQPINSTNWASLNSYPGPSPLAAGEEQTLVIAGLSPGQLYYAGVKAYDENNNSSQISNIASAEAMSSFQTGGDVISLLQPSSGASVVDSRPTLTFANVSENPANVYDVEISSDPYFNDIIDQGDNISQEAGTGTTSWRVSDKLEVGETYYWRAEANNNQIYSETRAFTISPAPKAIPNPFLMSETTEIRFVEVPLGSNLLIIDITGEPVRRWTNVSSSEIAWNGTNDAGNKVSSGTYLWYIEDTDIQGKVMVIR